MRPSPATSAHFRRASRAEMTVFRDELVAHGFPFDSVAVVPTEYTVSNGAVKSGAPRFATLYGDVDGDGKPEWVVGCYFRPDAAPEAADSLMARDDRARLAVFRRDGAGHWRFRWLSPGLGYEFHRPDYNMLEVERGLERPESLRPPISLVDIDHDGTLEIAYQCWSASPSVGGLPGVYRYEQRRWVGVAPQADRFSLQDLNHDGRLEVVTGSRFIGYGTGDDDVPRVWRWNGRLYQEASSEFPRFYADLASRYTTHVRQMQQRGEPYNRTAWERAIQKVTSLSGGLARSAGSASHRAASRRPA